jgi:hypothetical protein
VCVFVSSLSLSLSLCFEFFGFCSRSFAQEVFVADFVILLLLAAISDLHSCLSLSAAAA